MNMGKAFATVAAAGLFASAAAQAGVIATEDWLAADDLRDWSLSSEVGVGAGPGGLTAPDGVGNPASSLQVIANESGDFTPDTDKISTTNGDGAPFLGNYDVPAGQNVSFDFYLNNTAANGGFNNLQVYFVGDSITWYYSVDVSGQAGNSWETYTVNFGSSTGWTDLDDDLGFDSDKINVTEIGFRLTYLTNTDGQTYGFDNLRRWTPVPEPETYAAMAAALIGICIAFRRRISDTLSTVRVSRTA